MSLARGRYNATPPTIADGIIEELQLDVNGNLKTTSTAGTATAAALGTTADAAVETDANGTVIGFLRGLVKNLVVSGIKLLAGENHIGEVGGKGIEARDEFTRPDDATAYIADDVISATTSDTATTALRGLTLARKVGGTGYLRFWEIAVDHTTFLPRIRVHLYTVAAPTTALPGDNTLMVRKYANMPQKVGSFDMPALALPGGAGAHDMVYAVKDDLNIAFKCDAADTKLYYRYETLDAATPANLKKFYTIARADVD